MDLSTFAIRHDPALCATCAKIAAAKRAVVEVEMPPLRAYGDPIVWSEGAWWFYDETWSSLHGPFVLEDQARAKLQEYGDWLEGPSLEETPQMDCPICTTTTEHSHCFVGQPDCNCWSLSPSVMPDYSDALLQSLLITEDEASLLVLAEDDLVEQVIGEIEVGNDLTNEEGWTLLDAYDNISDELDQLEEDFQNAATELARAEADLRNRETDISELLVEKANLENELGALGMELSFKDGRIAELMEVVFLLKDIIKQRDAELKAEPLMVISADPSFVCQTQYFSEARR